MKAYKNIKGFTLVEVVVTLTILSLVMAAAIAYMIFGTKSFDTGENQARAQRNAQIICEDLTNELRNINELVLRQNSDMPPDNYIKGYKLVGGVFTVFSKDTTAGLKVDLVTNINIQLTQNKKGFVLGIEINTISGSRVFSINNQILLNNLKPSGVQGMEWDGRKYSLSSYTFYCN